MSLFASDWLGIGIGQGEKNIHLRKVKFPIPVPTSNFVTCTYKIQLTQSTYFEFSTLIAGVNFFFSPKAIYQP